MSNLTTRIVRLRHIHKTDVSNSQSNGGQDDDHGRRMQVRGGVVKVDVHGVKKEGYTVFDIVYCSSKEMLQAPSDIELEQ